MRVDSRADVERRDLERRSRCEPAAKQTVSDCERLKALGWVEVEAFLLVGEVEAWPHDRHAVDRAGSENAAIPKTTHRLVHRELRQDRGITREPAVAEDARALGEHRSSIGRPPRGFQIRGQLCRFFPHAREAGEQVVNRRAAPRRGGEIVTVRREHPPDLTHTLTCAGIGGGRDEIGSPPLIVANERVLNGLIASLPALVELLQQARRDPRLVREAGAEEEQIHHGVSVALCDARSELLSPVREPTWPPCRALGRRYGAE